jgi:sec-independent protein translocase protein TatA
MFGIGTTELIIILVILLLLFGSRLPNVMRSLGKSVNEFKKGMNEMTDESSSEKKNDTDSSGTKPAG